MNESLMLPAPTEYSDVLSGKSSEDDKDYKGEASDEEISSVMQTGLMKWSKMTLKC